MFHRIKKKVLKRQTSPSKSRRLPDRTPTATEALPENSSDNFGLRPLVDSTVDPSAPEKFPVDIVAIHGLNGTAYSTWRHPNGKLWLKDFLPGSLPGCRVFTYGYPSKVFDGSSFAGVKDYARALLDEIRISQGSSSPGLRPIIFVCHSLGGIVCKEALAIAHDEEATFQQVTKAIIGIVFLGTPHRGSQTANIAAVLGSILNICRRAVSAGTLLRGARTDLLDHLSYNSKRLQDLFLSSQNRLNKLAIVSFYETYATPPLPILIVDRESSILGIPNELVVPLWENHTSICRYPGETTSYKLVASHLREIARQSHQAARGLERTSTHSSDRTLTEDERKCVTLFNHFDLSEYKRLLPKPMVGTCQWIQNHSVFLSWLEKGKNALLWLTGNTGCGKTMLSLSLSQYFELNTNGMSRSVLVYLCDSKVSKQTDAKTVLVGLIFQVINRHRSLIRHVRRVFDLQGPDLIHSFSSLWNIFLRIVKDSKVGQLLVVLDALDECERITCGHLLDSISHFLSNLNKTSGEASEVKFLVTSRPFLHDLYGATSQAQLSIDESQSGYVEDLYTFIHRRVTEITLKRNYSDEIKDFLLSAMLQKADRTFLWINVVLASIENSLLTSMKDFRKIISSIPPELEETYLRWVSQIPFEHQETASKLLKLILASPRPLLVDEINIAYTIDSSHGTIEDVTGDAQNAIGHMIQGILGPFVRISDSRVSLAHPSVKEFLIGATSKYPVFPSSAAFDAEASALSMAAACIRYLSLEDFEYDLFQTSDRPNAAALDVPQVPADSPSTDYHESDAPEKDDYFLDAAWLFREPVMLKQNMCRSIASTHALYSYSSLYWADHFALCEESAPQELKAMARELLDANNVTCRNWMQVHFPESTGGEFMDNNPAVLAAYYNLHGTLMEVLHNQHPPQDVKNRSLLWAARRGHQRIVTALLDAGAVPDSSTYELQTALTAAAEAGHLACVVALLEDDRTNLSTCGRGGRTAFSFACGNGDMAMVKELLMRDTCTDQADYRGFSPFMYAASGGHSSIISLLARQVNVDINHRNRNGRTAVSEAAENKMDETLKQLSNLPNIDMNAKDNTGKSPLSWAAHKGSESTVDFLINTRGLDKDSVDNDGRIAISWASAWGHAGVLRILLKNGCSGADDPDVNGWTPLAWAIQTNSPECVRVLILAGSAALERRDLEGRTALFWAVEYRHWPVVRALLEEGANPEATTLEGLSPIGLARRNGLEDLLVELLSYTPSGKREFTY